MMYSYYDEVNDTEKMVDVYYHYEPEERGSRWHPPSPGMIDDITVWDENGIELTDLPVKIMTDITAKCMREVKSGIYY